jgi:hypothetical protein
LTLLVCEGEGCGLCGFFLCGFLFSYITTAILLL